VDVSDDKGGKPAKSGPGAVDVSGTCCLFVAGLLSIRFVSRPPAALERVALLVLVFGICANMLWDSALVPVVVGLVALLLARFASARTQIRTQSYDRHS